MTTGAATVSKPRAFKPPMPEIEGVKVSHQLVDVGGVRLHVAEAGEGPPLVLMHGYPQHWYVWRRFIPELAKRYRVICPDIKGFGWSGAPKGAYDKERLAKEMVKLFDELGVERARFVGHDWGAWLGYMIAMKQPERIERLVALSMLHPFHRFGFRYMLNLWHLWHGQLLGAPGIGRWAARPDSAPGRAIARWLGARTWSEEERRIFLDQFKDERRARATQRLYASVRNRDMPSILMGRYRRMGLKVPTLIITGHRDPAVLPNRIKDVAKYAPQARMEYVEAGHAILEERPAEVFALTADFLDQPAVEAER
jgi:pimeloyl-ACP methyl ester carboxylesterase